MSSHAHELDSVRGRHEATSVLQEVGVIHGRRLQGSGRRDNDESRADHDFGLRATTMNETP